MGSRSTPAVHTPAVHDDDYAGARSVSAHGEATASALRARPTRLLGCLHAQRRLPAEGPPLRDVILLHRPSALLEKKRPLVQGRIGHQYRFCSQYCKAEIKNLSLYH